MCIPYLIGQKISNKSMTHRLRVYDQYELRLNVTVKFIQ